MALVIPSGYAQTVLTLSGGVFTDNAAQVTLGVDTNGDPLGTVAVAVLNAWRDFLQPRLDDSVSLTRVDAFDETSIGAATANFVGAGGGSYPPANQAVLIEKRSNLRGPRNRGRMFIPSIVAENESDEFGLIAGPQLEAIQDDAIAFQDALTTASYSPVILHEQEGESPPGPPTPIIALVVDPKVATQRRRLRR